MQQTFTTDRDAKQHIADVIESSGADIASADDFDVDAIFEKVFTFDTGAQRFEQTVDVAEFWRTVAANAR